jgi:hypothetical protein
MSNPITDLKRELLAAAERQQQHAPAPVRDRRLRGSARALRFLPIGAAVAVAAAAALLLTAPWSNSPGFLARAEAALTPPEDMILHAKLAQTGTCLNTGAASRQTAEFWVDERTQGYRGLFHDPLLPYPFRPFTLKELNNGPCIRPSTYEAGVVFQPNVVVLGFDNKLHRYPELFRFVPPNRLYRYPDFSDADLDLLGRVPALDPVAAVRTAIRAGRAHDQGRTRLDGRTVERIRVDPCPLSRFTGCRRDEDTLTEAGGYAFVDPETYHPVEIRMDGSTTRFSTYEYLPRTAANLALTNIRAQHPHAQVVPGATRLGFRKTTP